MTQGDSVVLLVDDEPSLTQALAFTLEARGFSCVIVTDMSAAVTALREYHVRALVTDIMMPGGADFMAVDSSETGFHLIEYVQRNWPRTPIVCLSVIGDQTKIHTLTKSGVRYLRKGETPLSTAVEVISAVATGRKIRLD